PALVLELVEGPTLADRIGHGPLPLEKAVSIARQIAEALEAAHDHGIAHRDLKPANIKLTSNGIVKVLDFGLAKALGDEGAASDISMSPTMTAAATRAGVILGTAAYMSPEQARGKTVDKRTDIWAFGCVLYEMLTGRRAFAGDDVSDTLAAILRGEPDWKLLARSPAGMVTLLRRCLEKDPQRRLRDIADVRVWIDEAVASPAAEDSSTASLARRRERMAWTLCAVAATGLAALAVPATLYLRASAPEPFVTRFDVVTPPTT
ncbi:MAG: serine/threonine protein kinase, partial [Acidobacteria bacterium]|nr:serine/threonine protein kinase [Acidobacteriota bacterium]